MVGPSSVRNPRKSSAELEQFLESTGGLHTASALEERGFNRMLLRRAASSERVIQYARGIYCSPSALDEHGISLAALSLISPSAVVCLLSAAQVHELGDEDPSVTWLAIDRDHNAIKSGATNLPTRTFTWPDHWFGDGISAVRMAGVDVRVTDPARTVVDLIRHQAKVTEEAAMKAMQDYIRSGLPLADLWDRAKAVGFLDGIKPYYRLAETMREDIPTRTP